MQKRALGNTGLTVSAVGLGTWAFGGGTDWGSTDFSSVEQTLCGALEAGINLIDTAPIYGQSEQFIGRALAGKRAQVILATKCGLVKNGSWTDHDLRARTIQTQLETSLAHLHTDYIDIYLIHYLDPHVPWQEVLRTLERFKQQGKIRYIGVCNVPPEIVTKMADTGLLACVQEELSYLHPDKGLAALNICRARQLGFISYGSLCGGILSGKYTREPNLRRADARNYFYKCYRGENFARAQEVVQRVTQYAKQRACTPAQWALSWVLTQPGVTCALTGAKTPQQITENAYAADLNLCN